MFHTTLLKLILSNLQNTFIFLKFKNGLAPGMSIELFLLICFIITLVIHLLFLLIYIYPFAREFSAKLRNTHDLKDLPMVAIIIAARNEEDKIENTIRN